MEIINIKTKDLIPADYNPRMMDEKSAKDLEESITEFGLVDPIIVNKYKGRENIIIGGHQRYNIAKKMGFEELPCVYVELPLKAEKELNIRLNKNTGEWDWDMLANFDGDVLVGIGFEDWELEKFVINSSDSLPDLLNAENKNVNITLSFNEEQMKEFEKTTKDLKQSNNSLNVYELCKEHNIKTNKQK